MMIDERSQRAIAGLERRVGRIEGWRFVGASSPYTLNGVLYGNGTSAILATAQGPANSVLTANAGAPAFSATPTLTSLTLTAASGLLFTNASGRIVPGGTSFLIRNNADAATNLTLTDAGAIVVAGAGTFNNGGADSENSLRRDNSGTTLTSSVTALAIRNQNTTDGNYISARFVSVDSGSTLRNAAFLGVKVVTHHAAATTSQMEFQTANNSATPATRLTLGVSGEGADVLGSSTVTVSATQKSVLKLISTATNDDPTEDVQQGRAATTDATQTTINTIAIPASTTVMIHAVVIARRTGGSAGTAEDAAGYEVIGTYKNVSGTATLVGAVNALYTAESQAGWDATITVSGGNALVRVTGAANNNVTWHSTVRIWSVGT